MTTPTVLFGLRCTDPKHMRHHGRVYAESHDEAVMRSLAKGEPCNEVVASEDGGVSWAPIQ